MIDMARVVPAVGSSDRATYAGLVSRDSLNKWPLAVRDFLAHEHLPKERRRFMQSESGRSESYVSRACFSPAPAMVAALEYEMAAHLI